MRLAIIAFGIGTALGLIGTAVGLVRVQIPVQQPYPFDHKAHSSTECVSCHRGATRQAQPGIPSLELCGSCHATAPGDPTAAQLAAWEAAAEGDGPPWRVVHRSPDHVFYSHRRHTVLAELDCEECHGDVAERTRAFSRPHKAIRMITCVRCHERENTTTDCNSCHR
jgi:hypothetical protein